MAIGLRFDKGVSAGPADQSREDFAVGDVCTIVATGIVGTATFQILAPPLGSTAVLVPVDPLKQSITIDVAGGRWDIRVGDTADGSRVEHTFAAPTLLRGLIAPAHNERSSEDANAVDVDPGTWVAESHSNPGGRFTGHAPDVQKAVAAIELNADLALGARESGWVSGCEITPNGASQYDIATGFVRVQGVIGLVAFPGATAVDPLNIATRPFTLNGINASGELVQSNDQAATVVGATFRRNNALIQLVLHTDFATVTSIDGSRQTSEHLPQELLDLHYFTGPRNQGNDYTPAAADKTAQKSSGLTGSPGLSAIDTPLSPAYQANAAVNPVGILLVHRDGLGGFTLVAATDVPTGFWDNNATSLSATIKYVVYQMRFFNNITVCVPGQNTYDTEAEALAAVLTESTVLQDDLATVPNTYRTAIIASDISDLNNAALFTPPEGT